MTIRRRPGLIICKKVRIRLDKNLNAKGGMGAKTLFYVLFACIIAFDNAVETG